MKCAEVAWQGGSPLALGFDDIYYQHEQGMAESEYVFLRHNNLPQRWQSQLDFVIGETGFGTGLNFLLTWQAWRDSCVTGHLHFMSTENFPLKPDDLTRALLAWPILKPLADQLLAQYPLPIPGTHVLTFGNVTLTLLFGDATKKLQDWLGVVDAWYLDGFAPRKNSDMWQSELYQAMASHSKPETTFATFSAAGDVRRGLAEAGFEVRKDTGFGCKRDMLYGRFVGAQSAENLPLWYALPVSEPAEHVAIIGGGMAGCATAYALARRGIASTIYEAAQALAAGGSGNPVGLINGKLSVNWNVPDQLLTNGALFTQRQLLQLPEVPHQQCGMLHLAVLPRLKERFKGVVEKRGVTPNCARWVSAQEASELSGISVSQGGLWLPWVSWCEPSPYCNAMTEHRLINVVTDAEINSIQRVGQQWQLTDQQGRQWQNSHVVVANSVAAKYLPVTADLPIYHSPGQLTIAQANEQSESLRVILGHEGYLAPAYQGQHVLGATYRHDGNLVETQDDHMANFAQLQRVAPTLSTAFQVKPYLGRVASRATTTDHLPIAGALPDYANYLKDYARLAYGDRRAEYPPVSYLPGLYVNLAHGSKGLASAPLVGELIAAQITGTPLPVSKTVYQATHAGRFWLQQLRRGGARCYR